MRSMRQVLKECCTSVVLDNPFKKNFPQNHLDEDIFPQKKRAASGQLHTEPTKGIERVCLNVCPSQLGWTLWGMVTGEKTNLRII